MRRRSLLVAATPGTWAVISPTWPSWPLWSTERLQGRDSISTRRSTRLVPSRPSRQSPTTSTGARWCDVRQVGIMQPVRHPVPSSAPGTGPTSRRWWRVGLTPNTSGNWRICWTATAWLVISRTQKYQDPAAIAANTPHIIDDLVANFIASLPAEEVYHAAQERGFTWGAVRAPEQLLDDAHLHDRGFWKEVEHPELGRSFVYPGEAANYNG